MSKKKNKLLKQGIARRKRAQKKKLSYYDKHYFSLKGKSAEEILHWLAQNTFLTDWSYLNPILPDGKELCDLLVVFDNTALIWQLKDVKLKNGQIKESDYNKNITQVSGALRQLSELKIPIELNNPRRGKEIFDASKIERYFLIAAFFGDSPFFIKSMVPVKGKRVHVFTRRFTELVLNELDTIFDFTKYLHDKEEQHKTFKFTIVDGGEEEMLGYYILNNRTFKGPNDNTPSIAYFENGQWDELVKRKEYKAKQRENRISYCWDYFIDICHTGDSSEYELIAREMARHNRFERRILANAFVEAHSEADQAKEGLSFRRTISSNDITYCFLFHGYSSDESERELRKQQLSILCFIARGQIQENTKVIGIATDQQINSNAAFDYCFIDKPEWTKEDNEVMEQNMKDTRIFTKIREKHVQHLEFPKD